jgi:23S rRNA pseudouridine1911/1915/1917 synthase
MNRINIKIDERFNQQRIVDFLHYFHVSKTNVYLLQQQKSLKINDVFVPFNALLMTGDQMTIDLDQFEHIDFVPEDVPIDILYEDEDILVINKPSGIIIHPADKNETGTLVNRVAAYYSQSNINRQIRYLHRLDTETTGCILFAKHFLIHSYLANNWDHEIVKREYLALVSGRPFKSNDTLAYSIGKDRHNNNRFRVKYEGEKAITYYEVVDQYPNYALVRLKLQTGKTHQIRVHMSHIGHPLLGDTLYGGNTNYIHRVALHSSKIEFRNPVTGTIISVTAPLSDDFSRLL